MNGMIVNCYKYSWQGTSCDGGYSLVHIGYLSGIYVVRVGLETSTVCNEFGF
jgi:hypothetical protein